MKKRIIYSLTSRGLFSEISNLALAKVYTDFYNQKLIVNTRRWNARINRGWEDYFLSTLPCVNSIMSSQINVYKGKMWFGNIYYKPRKFFQYYFSFALNCLYLFFHPDTALGDEVFLNMRTKEFIEDKLDNAAISLSDAMKSIMQYNEFTNSYVESCKKSLNLPEHYMGVHIRRGDKITEQEMESIDLQKYLDAIIANKLKASSVYIATDDISVIPFFQKGLAIHGIDVYCNNNISQNGFDEAKFNTKNKEDRYNDTLNTLFDMDVLIHSTFFIGTYSSNVSRIVPLYIGFDNSISLDVEWNLTI